MTSREEVERVCGKAYSNMTADGTCGGYIVFGKEPADPDEHITVVMCKGKFARIFKSINEKLVDRLDAVAEAIGYDVDRQDDVDINPKDSSFNADEFESMIQKLKQRMTREN